jgi:hypothetical protein
MMSGLDKDVTANQAAIPDRTVYILPSCHWPLRYRHRRELINH